MARVHFGSGIVHELYERPIYNRTLSSESFIEKLCVLSELPSTELEAPRESPKLTVKTETVGYVNITSNWISEIQQAVSDQHNRLNYGRIQYFNHQLLDNNILAFNFCIEFVDFIFFIFIIIYAIIVIAFLVINHVMSYVDVYTEAVVISMFKKWHVM